MNLPNKLTLIRIILIPFFVAAYYLDFRFHYFAALLIFAVAAFTDFLDGHIARKYNMVTDLGKFLDPIADKVLVLTALVVMLADNRNANVFTYLGGNYLILGGIGVAIIVARELIISSLRMIAAKENIVLAAEKIGKIKTVFTDAAIIVLLVVGDMLIINETAGKIICIAGLILFGISVILTIISGGSYLIKNRGVIKTK